ncbi:hypothetical protein DMB44_03735 [Thermoplasma sp. Kam2015]|uniref:glycosyltransferase family 4 protein n=1 Tax=Thermoplasma sp. Kam2015 TaxID=2094122 RepID=UPI000D8D027A|nr:glycosyltransferase family 4 protein [Thermoplasma sp. Kam2015]PYB68462.1 hypothetical protein DMB44_03735 [Thermoplasma sp. Kam2015]
MASEKFVVLGGSNLEYDGGGERSAIQIATIAERLGYDVTILGSGSEFERKNINTGNITYIKDAFKHDPFANRLILKITHNISVGLIGLIKRRRTYEIIKSYDFYYFQNPNYLFLNLIKNETADNKTKKVILANHGTYFEILDARKNALNRFLSRVITGSIFRNIDRNIIVQAQNNYQREFYRKLGFKNIYLIPQCNIDFSKFSVKESDGFNVVFLNKITKNKGSDLLLRILKTSNDSITYHIIGKDAEHISRRINRKNVNFYGQVDEDTKRDILSRSDLMINLSKYESLSVSSIEGLASGLPIISTSTSGLLYIKDVIGDNIVISDRSVDEFLQKIYEFSSMKGDDADKYMMMRIKIRNIAKEHFDVNVIDDLLEKMLISITAKEDIPIFNI